MDNVSQTVGCIKESTRREKQILVDPVSLTHKDFEDDHNVPTSPISVTSLPTKAATGKSISYSVPNSTLSSPRFIKQKKKTTCQSNHRPPTTLGRQHSVALMNLEKLRESHMRRSKSCGEGRACQPSVDFDLWPPGDDRSQVETGRRLHREYEREEEERIGVGRKEGELYQDGKFKCGACLFLPGFGKGKAVRARKEMKPKVAEMGVLQPHMEMVSQRVSLEKFECGSWRSSAIVSYYDDNDGVGGGGDAASNLFFDLPMELMRCSSINDTGSPITSGFVFDPPHRRRGVLKNGGGEQPSPTSTSRHVRFSTSSPTSSCTSTPRLLQAMDDFKTFLEAQSA